LDVTQFTFDLPPTDGLTGIEVDLIGYSTAPTTLTAQIIRNGVAVGAPKSITMASSIGPFSLGSLSDLWGTGYTHSEINSTTFGVRLTVNSSFTLTTAFLDYVTITLGTRLGQANFNFITTFTQQDGTVKNIALDADGNLYVEDVTNNPGVLVQVLGDITPNSYATGVNGPDVEYLAFSNGSTGSDIPLQYTKDWIDRITQVGPGAPPVFTPGKADANTFAISTITQFPANSDITNPGTLSVLLQSTGPGSTAPGNVITVYYSPSFYGGSTHPEAEDKTLVDMFNSGKSVYVYISGTVFANGNYLVTSVGNAQPPGVDHFRYYFTVQAQTSAYQKIVAGAGQYQQSAATLTMAVPVPGLQVGNNVTISGSSVASWDATWPISAALNSAAMVITNTSVTASVATYNYSVNSGTPPTIGQLVTITGTTNANGALNLANATITGASGGTTGTFTLSVPVTTAASVPEDGLATTAGTIFQFDPGLPLLTTTTSPIYGNATGGTLTFIPASAQLIGPGTRQGSVFFITRNGYYTAPAPPVIFTCPENTTSLFVSQIPVGPPNVVKRGIIITEPGQNGTPGANFFTIPDEVDYVVNDVTYTATSFIIPDNVSTSATLTFSDSVLLNALAVDVYGYNLFNQIEIGDPGFIVKYAERLGVGLCRNKIQNFNNLSFDGGYLPSQQDGQLVPLGWSTPDIYGSLIVSPRFGNAYYIKNGGLSLASIGLITQNAYQDAYKVPILQPNTGYSVRVTARIPSGITAGALQIYLSAAGIQASFFSLPFSAMTTDYGIYEGVLTTGLPQIPASLLLGVRGLELQPNADVEIDRIEIFPTAIPVLTTSFFMSYAGLPEQFDAVTGRVEFSSENQQPLNGAVVMYDTLYGLKGTIEGTSMYSLQASANLEPAQWDEPEVAQKSGAIGILAYDFGEQWIAMANRNGLYIFEGGQPGKITQEIYQIWDSIYWPSAKTIWVKNDVVHRRLFIGLPIPTPNFYLPNAPVNLTPSSPNVILMCNYQGLDSGGALKGEPQMHTTMFGTLNSVDMRRKWSLWQIPSPYMAIVESQPPTLTGLGPLSQNVYICSGRANSRIYFLDDTADTDDGLTIDSLYTTAGLVELTKRPQTPMAGSFRQRWGYQVAQIETRGLVNERLLPNVLLGPGEDTTNYNAWTVPGGFSPGNPAMNDCECSLNFAASRTFFEFRENDGFRFSLSNLVLHQKADSWNKLLGRK